MDQTIKAILGIQHVKLMTTLSRTQIYAMERADMFPKRLPVSNTRGVWCRQEICAWMQRCVDARNQEINKQIVHINPADRFITKQELIYMVGISEPTFLPQERAGRFPTRIHISRGRVAWLHREVAKWLNMRPKAHESLSTGCRSELSGTVSEAS